MKPWICTLLFFATQNVFAVYQESPKACLKKEVYPCAVWVFQKTHLPRSGMQIYVSADTLFEIRESEVYLIRGNLWLVSERPMTVSSRFGSVSSDTKNEIWAQANDENLLVRALYKEIQVLPRGAKQAIFVDRGFEMQLGYIDTKLGVADYSWPRLVNLSAHLISFQTLVPSREVMTEKAVQFAKILLSAVKVAAHMDQQAFERKLASDVQADRRLKAEKVPAGGRDSYLIELFRRKSDFVE